MAKQSTQQLINELLAKLEPRIAAAFREALDHLRSTLDTQRVVAAIAAGDIDAALELLNINDNSFEDVLEAVREAYLEGGRATIEHLPQQIASFRFSGRTYRAEAWLRDHSAELVRQIVDSQRRAVRDHLAEGMARGVAPRSLVVQIVGRTNRATGRREGGILGLTDAQAVYVRRAADELSSGDSAVMQAYLQRGRRDRRFDRSVAKAIREGRPVEPAIAAKAIIAYERRLLDLRATTIARTEAMTALHAAQDEALRQAVDAGAVQSNQIRRVWRSASDRRVRETHRGLNGETVGLDEAFVSPSGAVLRFPGDPKAPAAERIACRCWLEPRIDFNINLR